MKVEQRCKLYTSPQSDSFRFLLDEATPSGVMTAISTVMPSALYALDDSDQKQLDDALANDEHAQAEASGACPAGTDIPAPSDQMQIDDALANDEHAQAEASGACPAGTDIPAPSGPSLEPSPKVRAGVSRLSQSVISESANVLRLACSRINSNLICAAGCA